jgi:hypothetical protein
MCVVILESPKESIVHHISSRHLRRTSTVRKYIRYLVAYVTATPTTECTREKNVDFDTFDGRVMVNYIEPNLQEFIFGPIRVGLITQKQFWDHLKNCHSWGQTP